MRVLVGKIENEDIFGYRFPLHLVKQGTQTAKPGVANELHCTIWIGLNVHWLFVIYFIDRPAPEDLPELLQARAIEAPGTVLAPGSISLAALNETVPTAERDGFIEALKGVFRFTFGGAEKVGFHSNYEAASVGGQEIVSI